MGVIMGDLVTNEEFLEYRRSIGENWDFPEGYACKPVVNVTYYDAMKYAAWYSKKTGEEWRLPTEQEMIEAEKDFEATFENHPLPECPDSGTFGRSKSGGTIRDLLGVLYQWVINAEDNNPRDCGWTSEAPVYF